MAFDITRRGLSDEDIRDIQFILNELDSTGMVAWVKENDAFHVVVSPEDEPTQFFRDVYDQAEFYHLPTANQLAQ